MAVFPPLRMRTRALVAWTLRDYVSCGTHQYLLVRPPPASDALGWNRMLDAIRGARLKAADFHGLAY